MDQLKLRTLVFEKTGVRIDVDDPVFALVALNEAVLAEHAHALQAGAGMGGYNAAHRPVPAGVGAAGAATLAPAAADKRAIATAAGAAALGALLVLLGQAIFFKIPPAPASTVIAKELTPEQVETIRSGEKMAKIVQKLDPKTRNAIQAEMQKP